MVRGPVREVVRGPSPLDWSMERGSVFSGHPKKKVFTSINVTSQDHKSHPLLRSAVGRVVHFKPEGYEFESSKEYVIFSFPFFSL